MPKRPRQPDPERTDHQPRKQRASNEPNGQPNGQPRGRRNGPGRGGAGGGGPTRQQRGGGAQGGAQQSHLTAWDPATNAWKRLDTSTLPPSSSSSTSSSTPLRLSCLTYNLWTSSPSHTPSQTLSLLSLLRTSDADVLALQEVTATFFARLLEEAWMREGYTTTTVEEYWRVSGKGNQGGGRGRGRGKGKEGEREAVVLVVKKALVQRGSQVGVVKLSNARDEGGKAAICVGLWQDGREKLRILTSHFTSLPENASIRTAQYRLAFSTLTSTTSPSSAASSSAPPPHLLLLADFNASSALEFAPLLAPPSSSSSSAAAKIRLVDACPPPSSTSASSKDPDLLFRHRPTFGHLYPYVTPQSRKPRKPRRIDRVYYSTPSPSSSTSVATARVLSYREIGDEPLRSVGREGAPGELERDRTGKDGRRWSSDHVGVRVEIEWAAAAAGDGRVGG